jgi:hypothetical protein
MLAFYRNVLHVYYQGRARVTYITRTHTDTLYTLATTKHVIYVGQLSVTTSETMHTIDSVYSPTTNRQCIEVSV